MMPRSSVVQFSFPGDVIEIPKVTDHEVRRAVWYRSEDIILMRMSAGDDTKDTLKEYCIDEEDYAGNRLQRKREAISYVLLQQQYLWEDDVEDPDLIAEVYAEETGRSQFEASERGARHSKHISELHSNTEDQVVSTNASRAVEVVGQIDRNKKNDGAKNNHCGEKTYGSEFDNANVENNERCNDYSKQKDQSCCCSKEGDDTDSSSSTEDEGLERVSSCATKDESTSGDLTGRNYHAGYLLGDHQLLLSPLTLGDHQHLLSNLTSSGQVSSGDSSQIIDAF